MRLVATRLLAAALLGRLLGFAATVIAAMVLLHGLLMAAPGDPIDLLPNGEELRPQLEAEWRLDRSPVERLAGSVGDLLRGELGTSLTVRPGAEVSALVAESGLSSLAILVPSLVLSVALGVGLAALTTGRSGRAGPLVQALSALPVFLLAWLGVTAINEATWALLERGLIARPAFFALPDQASALRTALAVTALAVGSGALFEVHAACEDELARIRGSGFVDAARALGLPVWPHVLLNLLPPLATVASSRVAFLVGGLVVVEKVLLLGGAGALLWEAALGRDYPLAIGLGLLAALVVAGTRLLADLARLALDPRLRERAG